MNKQYAAILLLVIIAPFGCSSRGETINSQGGTHEITPETQTIAGQGSLERKLLADQVMQKIRLCFAIQRQDTEVYRFASALADSIGESLMELDDEALLKRGIDYKIAGRLYSEIESMLTQEQIQCSAFLHEHIYKDIVLP